MQDKWINLLPNAYEYEFQEIEWAGGGRSYWAAHFFRMNHYNQVLVCTLTGGVHQTSSSARHSVMDRQFQEELVNIDS